MLRDLNDNPKRELPKTAPIDFIPKRLLPLVVNGGSPDRRSWECAVQVKLREELRSGNLAVRHSKRFGRLKDYFISDQQWDAARESFFLHSGLPADPNKVPAYLKDRLNKTYDWLIQRGHTVRRLCDDPPDYEVDGQHAVEVRRLNHRVEVAGQYEGEEQSRIALRNTV